MRHKLMWLSSPLPPSLSLSSSPSSSSFVFACSSDNSSCSQQCEIVFASRTFLPFVHNIIFFSSSLIRPLRLFPCFTISIACRCVIVLRFSQSFCCRGFGCFSSLQEHSQCIVIMTPHTTATLSSFIERTVRRVFDSFSFRSARRPYRWHSFFVKSNIAYSIIR